jgi:hypothetical protein
MLMTSLEFFSSWNIYSLTMILGFTQAFEKISMKNFPGGKGGRRVRLKNLSPSVSRVYRKCGIFYVSQQYGDGQSVTEIALLFASMTQSRLARVRSAL